MEWGCYCLDTYDKRRVKYMRKLFNLKGNLVSESTERLMGDDCKEGM